MSHKQNSPFFVGGNESVGKSRDVKTRGLPVISEGLDSVRAYQWEIHFALPPKMQSDASLGGQSYPNQEFLTLAAKQVTALGFSTEAIEVNRVNDKVFYPGKSSGEEVTVTFDNLYQPQIANTLWAWYSSIYDPTNGRQYSSLDKDKPFKNWKAQHAVVVNLDAHGQPLMESRMYGVWPISWKTGEFNYSTNDFHTIELVLRYDFFEHVTSVATAGSALVRKP